jgi:acyl-CoA thioesterase I
MKYVLLLLVLFLAGCTQQEVSDLKETAQELQEQVITEAEIVVPQPKTIVAFGDSLTAGTGVNDDESYPAVLQALLREQTGVNHVVINEGVDGETSAEALARVDEIIEHNPDIVILETGVNDVRRGSSLVSMEQNVESIVKELQAQNITVVIASMDAAATYQGISIQVTGPYKAIAERNNAPVIPYFLEGVLGDPALNFEDRVHPNAAGYRIIAEENVLPVILPLVA